MVTITTLDKEQPLRPVDSSELTLGQVERIEKAVGTPIDHWDEAPKGALFVEILWAVLGGARERYEALTLKDVNRLVSLSDDPEGRPEG